MLNEVLLSKSGQKPPNTTEFNERPEYLFPDPTIRNYTNLRLFPEIQKSIIVEGADKRNMQAYSDLLHKIKDDNFITNFHNALLMSYQYKHSIYSKKHNESKMLTSTNTTREKKPVSTISNIIDELEQKISDFKQLQNATRSSVKQNLIKAIYDPINGIETLIGRDDVKDILAAQLISFAANPMTFLTRINNFALLGSSGVGKTRLGEVISFFYSTCGLLIRDNFVVMTAGKLIKSHVNATAEYTNKVLNATLESILFIDEAYALTNSTEEKERGRLNHGDDAINEMVAFIDKNIGLSIIIVAGYQDVMERDFMKANEGLTRRFPNTIILHPYTHDQLTNILLRFIAKSYGPSISDDEASIIFSYIKTLSDTDSSLFDKQAGDMQILSSDMLDAIYSSKYSWIPGDVNNNHMIFIKAFNLYLARKNKRLMYS